MPVAAKYAGGKYANRICDICGFSYPYNEAQEITVRGKRTNLLACPTCWDPDHPQNFLPEAVIFDAEALRRSRPEDYYQSRILPHWRPSDSFALTSALGAVEVLT